MTPQWTSNRDALHQEIAKLRQQVEERDCEIGYLKDLMSVSDVDFSLRWHLTPKEEQVLNVLMAGGIKTREHICHVIYQRGEPHERSLDIFIMRLRQKLGVDGIDIITAWGRGFCLSGEHIAKIRELCCLQAVA
jgi:DNA-binding response OmpR family regulator